MTPHKRTLRSLTCLGALITLACGAVSVSQPQPSVIPAFAVVASTDSTLLAATAALADGRPWEATRLLAPLLRSSSRRTPAVVLRAAEAYLGWQGNSEALALLANEPWLGSDFSGHGHVLVARAALGVSPRSGRTDSVALHHAVRALKIDVPAVERGERETLLARAYDRLEESDSARTHYLRAGSLIPETRDWMTLRAAQVTPNAAERSRILATVQGAAARERRDWAEATALEGTRDFARAARLYDRLGAPVQALRVRLLSANDSLSRAGVRQQLLALLPAVRSGADVRAAIDLLAPETRYLTPSEQLVVARRAAFIGRAARAVAGFAVASRAGLLTDADRYANGEALLRLGRSRDAATQFAGVSRTSALYGEAAYQRARSLLRAGDGAAARSALLQAARDHSADTTAAASSLYLLGDLAADAGRNTEARTYFRRLSGKYPTSTFAPQARLRAAMISFTAASKEVAATELDTLYARYPNHPEALAALYWSGRAWNEAGRDSLARSRWRAVVERNGASYYAMLAARALHEPVWRPTPPGAADTIPRYADVDSAIFRMGLLVQLGFNDEAQLEEQQLVRTATGSVGRVLATAQALAMRGNPSRAIALGRRALDMGATPTATVYRLLYPVAQEPVLLAESKRNKLDPALVAALIKQESNFTPGATSAAGARGLMQVMPTVGRSLAQSMGFPVWDAVLLYQPDVNVQLGTRHLAGALSRYDHPAMALAGYNAGDARVKRWLTAASSDDAELFVERIPFVETRDYVRIVLRNREMYRALYGWPM